MVEPRDPLARLRNALACLSLTLEALPDAPTAAGLSAKTARDEITTALEDLERLARTPRLVYALEILRHARDQADDAKTRGRILVALAYLEADPSLRPKLEDLEQLERQARESS